MPTNHKNSDSENNLSKPTSNRNKNAPVINLSINTGAEQINDLDIKHEKDDNSKGSVTVNVVSQPNEYSHQVAANDIAKISNKISNKSFWINAGLFIGTLILAIIATCQYRSSQTAASIAQQTLDSTNAFNRRMFKLQRDAYKSSDIENKITLTQTKDYNDKLLSAQKDVLTETRKDAIKKDKRDSINFIETKNEFETENRPFLQVANLTISPLQHGMPFKLTYYFNNFGKLPAKVISTKAGITYAATSNKIANPKKEVIYGNIETNFYIANGVSQSLFAEKIDTLSQTFIDEYNKGNINVYFLGSCEYVNPVTNRKFLYQYEYKMNTKPEFTMVTIENSIVEEK